MKQRTLMFSYKFRGVGLHSGKDVVIELCPAPVDSGVVFQRIDLEGAPSVKADISNVYSTRRSTVLKKGKAKVGMVEHLLAALREMGLDNVLVKVDGPEIPILDGSAAPYFKTIKPAWIVEQEAERKEIVVDHVFEWSGGKDGPVLVFEPSDKFEAEVTIDFHSKVIGVQTAAYDSLMDFDKKIAPCRTFCFKKEIARLKFFGLIKGGSLDNALVVDEPKGYYGNPQLHFDNECARHKLLDLLGDLSLAGCPIRGRVLAYKPGHTANTSALKAFLSRK